MLSSMFSGASTASWVGAALLGSTGGLALMASSAAMQEPECDSSIELHPRPEAFHVDPQAFRMFGGLLPFRKHHPEAFSKLVSHMDNLLFTEDVLKTGQVKPSFGDASMAHVHIAGIDRHTKRLLASIDSVPEMMTAQRWCVELKRLAQHHIQNIMNLCHAIY